MLGNLTRRGTKILSAATAVAVAIVFYFSVKEGKEGEKNPGQLPNTPEELEEITEERVKRERARVEEKEQIEFGYDNGFTIKLPAEILNPWMLISLSILVLSLAALALSLTAPEVIIGLLA